MYVLWIEEGQELSLKEVHVFLINKISNVQYHTSRLPAVQIDSKIIILCTCTINLLRF